MNNYLGVSLDKRRKRYLTIQCITCKTKLLVSPCWRDKKTCSQVCLRKFFSKLFKGKKRPAYIGRKISKGLTGKKLSLKHRLSLSRSHIKEYSAYKFIQRLRQNIKYKNWRGSVFKRDNYTCVWCGQVGGKLQADHIEPFAKMIKDFIGKRKKEINIITLLKYTYIWRLNNGRTLCVSCHRKTDTWGNRNPGAEFQNCQDALNWGRRKLEVKI